MRSVTERDAARLKGQLAHWAYNALDCCTTAGVFEAIEPLLDDVTRRTYAFERACQAPAMAMMRRGILVDVRARDRAVKRVVAELKAQTVAINAMPACRDKWDGTELETGKCRKATRKDGRHKWPKGVPDAERRCVDCDTARVKREAFNPGSWQHSWRLFYDLHQIPKQKNSKRQYSVDEECLDRIARKYKRVRDVALGIVVAKGTSKQLGFLKSELSPAGRMHSSSNVGAAWTGRWSSSKDAYKRGTNVQNIAEKNRHIFIADPGMKLGYFDLSQSDSRVVAYDAEDEAYIAAHESGNVHVVAARMFWPDLPWTGDDGLDKTLAKTTPLPWHPDLMYYDQSKKNQHGLNFGLSPHGLAMHSHQPVAEAERAYDRYFAWAPRVKAWQNRIKAEVAETGELTNPLGRRCQFFGMRNDPHTAKQGLSFIPQSMTADVLNIALWHVWHDLDPAHVALLAQVHDAILFQFLTVEEEAVTREVLARMEIAVPMRGGRTMVIPVEPSTGWNWGKCSDANPRGMS